MEESYRIYHQSPKRKRSGVDGTAKKSTLRKTNNVSGISRSIDLTTEVNPLNTSGTTFNGIPICTNFINDASECDSNSISRTSSSTSTLDSARNSMELKTPIAAYDTVHADMNELSPIGRKKSSLFHSNSNTMTNSRYDNIQIATTPTNERHSDSNMSISIENNSPTSKCNTSSQSNSHHELLTGKLSHLSVGKPMRHMVYDTRSDDINRNNSSESLEYGFNGHSHSILECDGDGSDESFVPPSKTLRCNSISVKGGVDSVNISSCSNDATSNNTSNTNSSCTSVLHLYDVIHHPCALSNSSVQELEFMEKDQLETHGLQSPVEMLNSMSGVDFDTSSITNGDSIRNEGSIDTVDNVGANAAHDNSIETQYAYSCTSPVSHTSSKRSASNILHSHKQHKSSTHPNTISKDTYGKSIMTNSMNASRQGSSGIGHRHSNSVGLNRILWNDTPDRNDACNNTVDGTVGSNTKPSKPPLNIDNTTFDKKKYAHLRFPLSDMSCDDEDRTIPSSAGPRERDDEHVGYGPMHPPHTVAYKNLKNVPGSTGSVDSYASTAVNEVLYPSHSNATSANTTRNRDLHNERDGGIDTPYTEDDPLYSRSYFQNDPGPFQHRVGSSDIHDSPLVTDSNNHTQHDIDHVHSKSMAVSGLIKTVAKYPQHPNQYFGHEGNNARSELTDTRAPLRKAKKSFALEGKHKKSGLLNSNTQQQPLQRKLSFSSEMMLNSGKLGLDLGGLQESPSNSTPREQYTHPDVRVHHVRVDAMNAHSVVNGNEKVPMDSASKETLLVDPFNTKQNVKHGDSMGTTSSVPYAFDLNILNSKKYDVFVDLDALETTNRVDNGVCDNEIVMDGSVSSHMYPRSMRSCDDLQDFSVLGGADTPILNDSGLGTSMGLEAEDAVEDDYSTSGIDCSANTTFNSDKNEEDIRNDMDCSLPMPFDCPRRSNTVNTVTTVATDADSIGEVSYILDPDIVSYSGSPLREGEAIGLGLSEKSGSDDSSGSVYSATVGYMGNEKSFQSHEDLGTPVEFNFNMATSHMAPHMYENSRVNTSRALSSAFDAVNDTLSSSSMDITRGSMANPATECSHAESRSLHSGPNSPSSPLDTNLNNQSNSVLSTASVSTMNGSEVDDKFDIHGLGGSMGHSSVSSRANSNPKSGPLPVATRLGYPISSSGVSVQNSNYASHLNMSPMIGNLMTTSRNIDHNNVMPTNRTRGFSVDSTSSSVLSDNDDFQLNINRNVLPLEADLELDTELNDSILSTANNASTDTDVSMDSGMNTDTFLHTRSNVSGPTTSFMPPKLKRMDTLTSSKMLLPYKADKYTITSPVTTNDRLSASNSNSKSSSNPDLYSLMLETDDSFQDNDISFARDFDNLGLLGSGAFADVYKVREKRRRVLSHEKNLNFSHINSNSNSNGTSGRLYAVKKSNRVFRSRRDRQFLLKEITIMNHLCRQFSDKAAHTTPYASSQYIIKVIRAWQEDGYFFVQTQLAPRGTLKELLMNYCGISNQHPISEMGTGQYSSGAPFYMNLQPAHLTRCASANVMNELGGGNSNGYTMGSGLTTPRPSMAPKLSQTPKKGSSQPKSLPEATLWLIAHNILEGLRYIHSKGYVHLDIKPANILISEYATCKIGDFGQVAEIGKPVEDGSEGDSKYMCMDLLQSNINYDPSIDIFSFGMSMYELTAVPYQISELPSDGDMWQAFRDGRVPPLKVISDKDLSPKTKANIGTASLPLSPTALATSNSPVDKIVTATHYRSADLNQFILSCLASKPTHRPTTSALLNTQQVLKIQEFVDQHCADGIADFNNFDPVLSSIECTEEDMHTNGNLALNMNYKTCTNPMSTQSDLHALNRPASFSYVCNNESVQSNGASSMNKGYNHYNDCTALRDTDSGKKKDIGLRIDIQCDGNSNGPPSAVSMNNYRQLNNHMFIGNKHTNAASNGNSGMLNTPPVRTVDKM